MPSSGAVDAAWGGFEPSPEPCASTSAPSTPTQPDSLRIAALHTSRRPSAKQSVGIVDWLGICASLGMQRPRHMQAKGTGILPLFESENYPQSAALTHNAPASPRSATFMPASNGDGCRICSQWQAATVVVC